jgi:transposase
MRCGRCCGSEPRLLPEQKLTYAPDPVYSEAQNDRSSRLLTTMKPYSTDVRVRVRSALEAGMPRADAVRIFHVSVGRMKRWLRLRRTTGDLPPQRPSGRPTSIPPDQEPLLRVQLDAAPAAALAEHAAPWHADHGTTLRPWTIGRALRRLAWARKNRP